MIDLLSIGGTLPAREDGRATPLRGSPSCSVAHPRDDQPLPRGIEGPDMHGGALA